MVIDLTNCAEENVDHCSDYCSEPESCDGVASDREYYESVGEEQDDSDVHVRQSPHPLDDDIESVGSLYGSNVSAKLAVETVPESGSGIDYSMFILGGKSARNSQSTDNAHVSADNVTDDLNAKRRVATARATAVGKENGKGHWVTLRRGRHAYITANGKKKVGRRAFDAAVKEGWVPKRTSKGRGRSKKR